MPLSVLKSKVKMKSKKPKISLEDREEYLFYLVLAGESGGRA